MAKDWRRRSPFTKRKFQPFAQSMGQLALAWNDFHEALGDLYIEVLADEGSTTFQAIRDSVVWASITSDRQKRVMLEAAANWISEDRREEFPSFVPDIKWLVGRGHSLEDRRNDVLHATLTEVPGPVIANHTGLKVGDVMAGWRMLNERSAKLAATTWRRGKPLLTSLRLYRDYASALAHYTRDLQSAFQRRAAWPERPALPPLPEGKKG